MDYNKLTTDEVFDLIPAYVDYMGSQYNMYIDKHSTKGRASVSYKNGYGQYLFNTFRSTDSLKDSLSQMLELLIKEGLVTSYKLSKYKAIEEAQSKGNE